MDHTRAHHTGVHHSGANRAAGFTLIELLIVIAILGTLAAVLLPNILGADETAKVTATEGNMLRLETGIEAFQRKWGFSPPDNLQSPAKELVVDWKNDNGQNTGIESLVAFLSMSKQGGADLSDLGDRLVNTDKDDHGAEQKLLRRKDRVEIADAWGMPLAYWSRTGMDKQQLVTSPEGDTQSVRAKKDERGNYHGQGKFQLLSAGKDGVFGSADDLVWPKN